MNKFAIWGIFLVFLSSCSPKMATVLTTWAEQDVLIDGQCTEWTLPLDKSKKYPGFEYKVKNDEQQLFICLRIVDKGIQTQIMSRGLSLWVDTVHKRKEVFGIGFPLGLSEGQIKEIARYTQDHSDDPFAMEKGFSLQCQEFELIGFAEERLRLSNMA